MQFGSPQGTVLNGVAPLVTSKCAAAVRKDSKCIDAADCGAAAAAANAWQELHNNRGGCALHAAGGFVFLRPCRAVYEHMVSLATKEERLQFSDLHAEQTFISW
jgi:hypothetical protein